jgi:adenine-specific DNA methylase
MLMALLLPDPCDPHCPADFKRAARDLLTKLTSGAGTEDLDLRRALLKFIGDFANWDLAAHAVYLEVARGLVRAAHPEERPLVVDPFAGGGSIPLEALRLGCEAFASDLNPVACLILKVMLEDIPRHGPGLAEELRRVGAAIKEAAEKELADLYPPDPDGARPIAYLWARTVRCEAPDCGAEIPLVRSFWLCKKAGRKRALRPKVLRRGQETPAVGFEIFSPQNDGAVPSGTVARAKATCVCCGKVVPAERVRAQLREMRGGADVVFDVQGQRIAGARLLCVMTLRPGEQGRHYRLPTERDYEAVRKAMDRLKQVVKQKLPNGLNPVPDEPLPTIGTLGFRVQRYGMLQWGDLFTARQKVALVTLAARATATTESAGPDSQELVAIAVDKTADLGNALAPWKPDAECPVHLFARQAIGMAWDFAESVPSCSASGSFESAYQRSADALDSVIGCLEVSGQVQLADAAEHPLPCETSSHWFTDPPYYDAVPYADLSDFFLVWLRRVLPGHPLLRDPFDPVNPLSPKRREAVQDETKRDDGHPKDRTWFEETMARAFAEGRRVLHGDGIGSVVFAHKTTEGWEALLSGMIRGGWTITGSWPIATEMGSRLRARDSAALATSVHLVCRPRPVEASVGDWSELLRELPRRVQHWMERLQQEGVRGADLVFACIGPALELFSRHSRVETAEGTEVTLANFLEKVWEVVGRAALRQILGGGDDGAGALEEDARLTALFLWTLQASNGGENDEDATSDDPQVEDAPPVDEEEDASSGPAGLTLIYDVARRFAQPLGIHLPDWEGRIIENKKGVVRLLPVAERARQLFGDEGAEVAAERLETGKVATLQLSLFPAGEQDRSVRKRQGRTPRVEGVADHALRTRREATTLDRVHAAMLLHAAGRTNALRALIMAEQERGPEFLRLANALCALYPRGSEERRLLEAMVLAVPR